MAQTKDALTDSTPGTWETANTHVNSLTIQVAETGTVICDVWPMTDEDPTQDKQSVANANLLAYAPRLYEHLRNVCDSLSEHCSMPGESTQHYVDSARKLLRYLDEGCPPF